MPTPRALAGLLAAMLLAGAPASADAPTRPTEPPSAVAPRLSLPIACEPRVTCFIQNYVDIDLGSQARDYRCGAATYDGHKGVDFRVLSAAVALTGHGVPVLAAALGVVKGSRDGMADSLVRETGKAAVTGRECGNGLVLDHGGGWETQYCHFRRGSLAVKPGQSVTRGQLLGRVGYSGLADFAHVHLSVRHDGRVIDPFTGRSPGAACARDASVEGLWDDAAAAAFPAPLPAILGAGFIDAAPDVPALSLALEKNHAGPAPPTRASTAIVLYARMTSVRQGDRLEMALTGPEGFHAESSDAAIPQSKALLIAYVGKRRSDAHWPAGRYHGTITLTRDGREAARREVSLELAKK